MEKGVRSLESGARRRISRREFGLTLVELIVAFTIMTALSTMSVPLVRGTMRRNARRTSGSPYGIPQRH